MQGFKIQRDYRRRGLPGHSGVKVDVVVDVSRHGSDRTIVGERAGGRVGGPDIRDVELLCSVLQCHTTANCRPQSDNIARSVSCLSYPGGLSVFESRDACGSVLQCHTTA
jgi:hypothetical protein